MQSKTLVLVIILAVVSAILIFFALRSQSGPEAPSVPGQVTTAPTRAPVEKTASIYFQPGVANITKAASTSSTVDIMVDTDKDQISGVQLELTYDPSVISNVSVSPPSAADTGAFFADPASRQILFNEGDAAAGTYSYAVGISPNAQSFQGIGKVATLSFTVIPTTSAANTQITIDENSNVTKIGEFESILKTGSPLMINIQ